MFRNLYLEEKYADIELVLKDNNKMIIKKVHRAILSCCKYFDAMFSFDITELSFEMIVDDVDIMNHIIASFYGVHVDINYNKWEFELRLFISKKYLLIDTDIDILCSVDVDKEDFDYFLELLDKYELIDNWKIIGLIKKNLPRDYNLDKLSGELAIELMKKDLILTAISNRGIITKINVTTNKKINNINRKTGYCFDNQYMFLLNDNNILLVIRNYLYIYDNDLKLCEKTQFINSSDYDIDLISLSPDNKMFIYVDYFSNGTYPSIILNFLPITIERKLPNINNYIILDIIFTPDNTKLFFVGFQDPNITTMKYWIYDLQQEIITESYKIIDNVDSENINVKIIPNATKIIFSYISGTKIFDIDTKTLVHINNNKNNISVSPDNNIIILSSGTIMVLNSKNNEIIHTINENVGRKIKISANNNFLVYRKNCCLHIYDLETQEIVRTIKDNYNDYILI